MSTLKVEGLVTGYGKLEVLHGVDLEADMGQVTCVFGPNGSGKSTLVKAVAGILGVWRGRVTLDGQDLSNRPPHRVVAAGICLMPQGGGVFPQLTVEENLRVGGYILSSGRQLKQRVEELLDEFPALRRRQRTVAGNLSGGEQMMLAIARALVNRPRFLLLDEPSAGLSPKMLAETLARIRSLKDSGVGILIVEQNIREARRIADAMYILVAGRNRFRGTPADVRDERYLMDLYLGVTQQE